MADIRVSGEMAAIALGVVAIPTLIVGYATLKNSKPIYNFYKAMFGEKYINPTYMAVGVVLLVILFQYINKVICPTSIFRDKRVNTLEGEEIVVQERDYQFICSVNNRDGGYSLSMIRYISFILLLIIGYYLYRNKQIKLTENKLLVLSTILFAIIGISP